MLGTRKTVAAKKCGFRQDLRVRLFSLFLIAALSPTAAKADPALPGSSIIEAAPFALFATAKPGYANHAAVGNAELVMQSDGNLVLYRNGDMLWSTALFPKLGLDPGHPVTRNRNCPDCYAMFKADGNLVLIDPNDNTLPDHAYWSTAPYGKPGALLQISMTQPYIQILGASHLPLWVGSPFLSCASRGVHPEFNPWVDEPYAIGAWYYTGWSQTSDMQGFQSAAKLGRWDPWGGVRDGYKDPSKVMENSDKSFVPRQPAIGFYDQIGQPVMDEHIRQAASRGLSYFAFYWYWDADRQAESQNSTPIHRFVSSPYKSLMKFMIAPVRSSGHEAPPPTTLQSFKTRMVPYLVDNYVTDPSYLRSPEGQPMIADWDFGLAPDDRAAGLQYLREYVFAKVGKYPLILGIADHGPDPDADGSMCFNMNLTPASMLEDNGRQQAVDYAKMMATWPTKFAEKPKATAIPCTTAGFDARPWCALESGMCQPGKPYWYYNTGMNPGAFRDHLNLVKGYLDTHPETSIKALTIYAWNEWGEGGVIEPSQKWGTDYIDAIQMAFGLHPRTQSFIPLNLEAIFFTPDTKDTLFETYAYQTFLGRTPSMEEMQSFASAPLDKIGFINNLLVSPEYQLKWESELKTATNMTVLITEQILGRNPTPAELKLWVPRLAEFGIRDFADNLLYSREVAARDPVMAPSYSSADAARGVIEVYRLRLGSDYLYTSDVAEVSKAVTSGYKLDGPAWKVFRDPRPKSIALLRCFDGIVHFLSVSPTCENQEIESVLGYGYATALPGTDALLRYKTAAGSPVELMTADTEGIKDMTSHGFRMESPLLYVPAD